MAVPDEGFDFLGYHFRRQRKKGTSKYYAYTKPFKKAIQAIKDKVKVKTYRSTRNQDLDELITSLNQTLVGWALYFLRHGVSKAIFNGRPPRVGPTHAVDTRQVQGQEIPTRNA
jgi:RNA-directed DNA polymerase